MRDQFIAYYRPTEQEFMELWEKCLFVLDTNVLLNLYRYSQQVRDVFFKVFEQLSYRLWIPHQVALEYHDNRLGVIADQKKTFNKVRTILDENIGKLKSSIADLQLGKRHATINPHDFLAKLDDEVSRFRIELDHLDQNQLDVSSEDPVRDKIDELLNGKIGQPFPKDELEEILKDGERRKRHELPPGYMDRKKEADGHPHHFWNGTLIPREYGDLVLWHQIIKHAKDAKITHLIFVTDDHKEDWWWKVDSQGSKTIGPRPELVNEIRSEAGVSLFYMYTSASFLKNAQQYLKMEIGAESIEQVRDIEDLLREAANRSRFIREDYLEALENVRREKSRDQCIQEAIGYFLSLFPDERYREARAQGVLVSWPADAEPAYLMQLEIVSFPAVLEEALALTNPFIEPTKTLNAAIRLWLERIAGVKGLKP